MEAAAPVGEDAQGLSGWYEQVSYINSNCSSPDFKSVTLLNTCQPSAVYSGMYSKITATANSTSNTYYMTETVYKSSSCSSVYQYVYWTEPILICTDNTLTHIINYPLNATTDNLGGLAIGIFTNYNDCMENNSDDFSGLIEYDYYKFNYCYKIIGGDVMFTGCSPTGGYTYNIYNSNNYSCTDFLETKTQTPSQMCTGPTYGLQFFFGWENFVCENQ